MNESRKKKLLVVVQNTVDHPKFSLLTDGSWKWGVTGAKVYCQCVTGELVYSVCTLHDIYDESTKLDTS